MTNRFTTNDIKLTLSELRSQVRNSNTVISVRVDKKYLRFAVASAFGIDADAFNVENFNPQTLLRFSHLFDVPSVDHGDHTHVPTQDEIATALQNFINRRKNVWAHFVSPAKQDELAEAFARANT